MESKTGTEPPIAPLTLLSERQKATLISAGWRWCEYGYARALALTAPHSTVHVYDALTFPAGLGGLQVQADVRPFRLWGRQATAFVPAGDVEAIVRFAADADAFIGSGKVAS